MSEIQCFKIKQGTDFDKSVKKHFSMLPKWKGVFKKLSELLDENITMMCFDPNNLHLEIAEIKKDENKKLFTKSGRLKTNTKKSRQVLESFKKIVGDEGLSEYKELSYLNFAYGIMRFSGEELESYRTSEYDIYYKTNFDLKKRSHGLVEPITEIEYQEKYLEELKKQEQNT